MVGRAISDGGGGKAFSMRNVPRKIGRMMALRHHGSLAVDSLCAATAMLSMQMLIREREEAGHRRRQAVALWRTSWLIEAKRHATQSSLRQARDHIITTGVGSGENENPVRERARSKKGTMASFMARERSRSQAKR